MKRIRLGDLLVEKKFVTAEQLDQAIAVQQQSGKKLGQTFIDMALIDEDALLALLSQQLKIPYINLDDYPTDSELIQRLPETYARRYRAIILKDEGSDLLVGLADPLDIYAFDELTQLLQRSLHLAIVKESQLLRLIDVTYRHTQEISSLADELSGELAHEYDDLEHFEQDIDAEEAPVVKLLQSVFKDAVRVGASDIHIEPDEEVLRIRLRVDGVLQESVLDDARIAPALVQRLKLRAKLDISERRIPQDGRFYLNVKGKSFDVRLSTMPIGNGESVVMRLLDQSAPVLDLTTLGMTQAMADRLNKLYRSPHGLLLVTGPTGSGKTTTLYSILTQLNSIEKKVITVEDPVEYRLPRINQVQVNNKIDFGFARVLRSILRQDPDTIMVGELRDAETAQIALRAAITGHLVLSTLHTNDAMSSAMRLIDMGSEGYMVATALRAVLAQRLVRKNCIYCGQESDLSQQEKTWLTGFLGKEQANEKSQYKSGKGCNHCNDTGFRGRLGVYELLEPDSEMLEALRKNDALAFARATKNKQGYDTLGHSALTLARQGLTTVAEVIRIVGEVG